MAWTLYLSTDPSAPVLTGAAGGLVALLDACLVNGYGSKPAAGWTKAFTGTNKAAYRAGAGARCRTYLRVNDAGAGTGGAKEALIRGFEAMTDVDNGTNPFPSSGQSTLTETSLVAVKSSTTDGTARPWVLAGDDRTFILFVKSGSVYSGVPMWAPVYFGEFFSYLPNDAYQACILAGYTENRPATLSTTNYDALPVFEVPRMNSSSGAWGAQLGHFIARLHTGLGGSVGFTKFQHPCGYVNSPGVGHMANPNPADGNVWMSPISLATIDSGLTTLRGHLRGIYLPLQGPGAFNDGDTFGGMGDLAGRGFRVSGPVYRYHSGQAYTSAIFALETLNPPSS